MSSISPVGSICAGCFKRHLRPSRTLLSGAHQQIRGKSKIGKKATTIAVRLRQDLPEYGRSGSIVAVPMGVMRNAFYPQRIADYISMSEKLQMKRDGIVAERDPTFGRAIPEALGAPVNVPETTSSVPKYNLKTIKPNEAFELLSNSIPFSLDFYRTPITGVGDRGAQEEPEIRTDEAIKAAPSTDISPHQPTANIFGSVSATDVNLAIKTLLQNNGMHGLVVLSDEDIKFVNIAGTHTEAVRLKQLGVYQYEVRIKGHADPIRRSVRVLPDEVAVQLDRPRLDAGSAILDGLDETVRVPASA
ncbi:hypothetical protein FH972_026917 [Carpinus fangiana]|uniref:Ribosomal protein L9 domain-containing protein n=1 Tax=Carpinus fangiana TaxID=176857 RepID=A0A5N6L5G4_9ROSI|nr:hypothetical protein FH972_026917 [Carpinus fangiana]